MASAGQTLSVLDLPTTVLALCLEHFADPKDLAKACCACRAFRDAGGKSSPSWRTFCQRWRHWHQQSYTQLYAAQDYKAVYALKLQADIQARNALAALVFPFERSTCMRNLKHLGADAKDITLSDCAAEGSMNIGRRHWASHALIHCNAAECAQQLRQMLDQQQPDVLQGAMGIASALDPGAESAVAAISGHTEKLAHELRRQMDAVGAGDNLEGLKLLKQLLFGRRSDGFTLERFTVGGELPPVGAGLQLRGNRDDYYAPANSLLHKVFETGLGIPISLSVIAVAVGRGAGLSMACVNAPGHFMAKLDPGGTAPVHYLDAFQGSIMDRRDMQQVCAALGVPLEMLEVPPMAASVLQRMCVNLLKIFEHTRDFVSARTISELLCAIVPGYRYQKVHLAQMHLLTGDPDTCTAILLAMEHEEGSEETPGMDRDIRALLMRAQSEKRSLVDQAASRHRRAEFPAVQHRVGDVVEHRRYGYKGVIYGWDERCKASEHWCQAMNVDALPGGRTQPFYNVLVDVRQRPGSSTYVAQENIEVKPRAAGEADECFLVQSDEVGEHFDGIEPGSSRYSPNAYLRRLYPEDP